MQEEIHRAIVAAKLTVFLGFGFHKPNMALLNVGARREGNGWAPVMATKQGLHEANDARIKAAIANTVSVDLATIDLFDMAAQAMLTNLEPSIMQMVG